MNGKKVRQCREIQTTGVESKEENPLARQNKKSNPTKPSSNRLTHQQPAAEKKMSAPRSHPIQLKQ